jgi:hypothetical protein
VLRLIVVLVHAQRQFNDHEQNKATLFQLSNNKNKKKKNNNRKFFYSIKNIQEIQN